LEKSIKPTLYDLAARHYQFELGGKNPYNFFLQHRTDPQYGFHEFHAKDHGQPAPSQTSSNESMNAWLVRRAQFQEALIKDNDPLVYAQEYLAES